MTAESGTQATCATGSGVGWYVYGVVPWSVEVPVTAGIEAGGSTAFIFEGSIMAVASRVPLAVFDSEPLRKHMEDPQWLAERVCRHEAVVESLMARGPVLPMKFCTIFQSPGAVRRMLREHAARFQEALEFVRDKEEWAVKGFAHRGCLRAGILHGDPELRELAEELVKCGSEGPGRAFLLKRRMDDLAERRAREREAELVREAVEALRPSAVQLAFNEPLRVRGSSLGPPSAPGPGETTALNLACLVLRPEVQTFLANVRGWNEEGADQGLRLVTSGPWPPYNFSPRLESHAR